MLLGFVRCVTYWTTGLSGSHLANVHLVGRGFILFVWCDGMGCRCAHFAGAPSLLAQGRGSH